MAIAVEEPQQPYRKSPTRKKMTDESVRITAYRTRLLKNTPSNGGRMANLQPQWRA